MNFKKRSYVCAFFIDKFGFFSRKENVYVSLSSVLFIV